MKELSNACLFLLVPNFPFLVTIRSNGKCHILAFLKLSLLPGVEKVASSPMPGGISGIPWVTHLRVH